MRVMALYGRDAERSELGTLLEAARASRGAVLVIRGAAGAGKSALLDDAMARAEGMRVLRPAGVKTEAELAFAGLHQLVWPLRAFLGRLAPKPATALLGALGLAEATSPQRFSIGAATLELLAAAAEERPLLCLIDDAQWLDGPSAEAFTFAARRLDAEAVGFVFATRDGDSLAIDTAGFRELRLGSLGPEAAEALLFDRGGAQLKAAVRARILEMAQGNPLALLELPLSPGGEQLLGPFGTPMPLTPALEDAFLARARGLSPASQRLLLLAAADDTGDRACVLGAAAAAGHRRGRGRGCRGGGPAARDRRQGQLPPSAGPLGGVCQRAVLRTSHGPPGAGPHGRPGPPGLAPGGRPGRPRRHRGRRARGQRAARPGAQRFRSGRRRPAAGQLTDHRPAAPGPAARRGSRSRLAGRTPGIQHARCCTTHVAPGCPKVSADMEYTQALIEIAGATPADAYAG